MLLIEDLFLFLVRVSLGLFEQDLADRLLISSSTVSRKTTTWANYLYFLLVTQPVWASREQIHKFMPQAFKALYSTTRVIIDCALRAVCTDPIIIIASVLPVFIEQKQCQSKRAYWYCSSWCSYICIFTLYRSISDKDISRCCGPLDRLEENRRILYWQIRVLI